MRLHDLRHTYASLAVSQNLSLPIVGALLGHKSAKSTERYAHLYSDVIAEAAMQTARGKNHFHGSGHGGLWRMSNGSGQRPQCPTGKTNDKPGSDEPHRKAVSQNNAKAVTDNQHPAHQFGSIDGRPVWL